jgi:hypothetical protein
VGAGTPGRGRANKRMILPGSPCRFGGSGRRTVRPCNAHGTDDVSGSADPAAGFRRSPGPGRRRRSAAPSLRPARASAASVRRGGCGACSPDAPACASATDRWVASRWTSWPDRRPERPARRAPAAAGGPGCPRVSPSIATRAAGCDLTPARGLSSIAATVADQLWKACRPKHSRTSPDPPIHTGSQQPARPHHSALKPGPDLGRHRDCLCDEVRGAYGPHHVFPTPPRRRRRPRCPDCLGGDRRTCARDPTRCRGRAASTPCPA